LNVSMADETIGSSSADVLYELEKLELIWSTGTTLTIGCQTSEVSLTYLSKCLLKYNIGHRYKEIWVYRPKFRCKTDIHHDTNPQGSFRPSRHDW
jgi:hypothetical protein